MKKYFLNMAVAVMLTVGSWAETNAPAATPVAIPAATDESEIIRALKSHYVDRDKLDDKKINDASVAGVLTALGRGAQIVKPEETAPLDAKTSEPAGPVARAEIIEPDIGYIRLTEVTTPAVVSVDAELKKFSETKVSGYVLDLRFAGGDEYTAAAQLASRFLNDGQELFRIKQGAKEESYRASAAGEKLPALGKRLRESPLLLLVNGQTRGSAEALAGALRAQDRGIVIGGLTAGAPVAWDNVPLSDGRVLRVATAKVVLTPADPQSVIATDLFSGGLAPDIFVSIDPAVERDVLSNVTTNITLTVSLQPQAPKKRMSEAELLKAFRGESLELSLPKPKNKNGDKPESEDEEGQIQPVRDVVLQRAVDVLKGIRVLLSSQ